jgi:hypothetical protein
LSPDAVMLMTETNRKQRHECDSVDIRAPPRHNADQLARLAERSDDSHSCARREKTGQMNADHFIDDFLPAPRVQESGELRDEWGVDGLERPNDHRTLHALMLVLSEVLLDEVTHRRRRRNVAVDHHHLSVVRQFLLAGWTSPLGTDTPHATLNRCQRFAGASTNDRNRGIHQVGSPRDQPIFEAAVGIPLVPIVHEFIMAEGCSRCTKRSCDTFLRKMPTEQR